MDNKRAEQMMKMNMEQLAKIAKSDFYDDVMSNVATVHEHATIGVVTGHICGCGDVIDAHRAAARLYLQMRDNQCFYWSTQVIVAMRTMDVFWHLLHAGFTVEELSTPTFNNMTEQRVAELLMAKSMINNSFQAIQDAVIISAGSHFKEVITPLLADINKAVEADKQR